MTSAFIPGMANRFVSEGGGWKRAGGEGDGRHVRVQTHVRGRGWAPWSGGGTEAGGREGWGQELGGPGREIMEPEVER